MALADYHLRSALAAAQIIAGFDEAAFRRQLEPETIEIAFGADAKRAEGRYALDLVVRLVARLYPVISLQPRGGADVLAAEMSELARRINPNIDITSSTGTRAITIGERAKSKAPTVIYAGSVGPDALISTRSPVPIGRSQSPFGSGAAAGLAVANLFRAVFLPNSGLDRDVVFSTIDLEPHETRAGLPPRVDLGNDSVLVGLGAIGNAAAWALARADATGSLSLVDHQDLELSNLQRYVLAGRADEHAAKTTIAEAAFLGAVGGVGYKEDWANFVASHGYRWRFALVALDSARDRRAVAASLPQSVFNAWTQPGDLGVSTHDFLTGACLACLYLPAGRAPNEDEIVAAALRIPDRLREVRDLLHLGSPLSSVFLEIVAAGLGVDSSALDQFEGRNIRQLYVEGLCGGAVVPLSRTFGPPAEVHVPLAHQSALAGVLLAAQLIRANAGPARPGSFATRLDVLRPVSPYPTAPIAKDPRGICTCQDPVYVDAFEKKFARTPASTVATKP